MIWPFRRKAKREPQVADWTPGEGFRPVLDPFTGRYNKGFDRTRTYEFVRQGWDGPAAFRMADQHPLFNIAGLYFREVWRWPAEPPSTRGMT